MKKLLLALIIFLSFSCIQGRDGCGNHNHSCSVHGEGHKEEVWETIEKVNIEEGNRSKIYSDRLRVPGGWIVRSYTTWNNSRAIHQIFVADEHHIWDIK